MNFPQALWLVWGWTQRNRLPEEGDGKTPGGIGIDNFLSRTRALQARGRSLKQK